MRDTRMVRRNRARLALEALTKLWIGGERQRIGPITQFQRQSHWASPQKGQRSDRACSGFRQCQQKRGCGASRALRRL